MSNTKISALTPGTPAQSTDVIPIDRAGANFSLTASDIVGGAAPANVVSTAGILTANQLVIGAGTKTEAALGALGTTTTVLHGNASGAPSFAQVTSSDIDGTIQPTASPTFTGTVTAPTIKATKAVSTGLNAMGNVTGATSVDLSLGNVVSMTLTGNITLSFTNAVASVGQQFTLIITQDGTGARVVTWPTTVDVPTVPRIGANDVTVIQGIIDGAGVFNFLDGPRVVFRSIILISNPGAAGTITTHENLYQPTVIGNYRINMTLWCSTSDASGDTAAFRIKCINNNNAQNAQTGAVGLAATQLMQGQTSAAKVSSTGGGTTNSMGYDIIVAGSTAGLGVWTAEFNVEKY